MISIGSGLKSRASQRRRNKCLLLSETVEGPADFQVRRAPPPWCVRGRGMASDLTLCKYNYTIFMLYIFAYSSGTLRTAGFSTFATVRADLHMHQCPVAAFALACARKKRIISRLASGPRASV